MTVYQNCPNSQRRLDSHIKNIRKIFYSKWQTRNLGQALGFPVKKKKKPTGMSQNCPLSQVLGYTQLNTVCMWGQMTASSFFAILSEPNSFDREGSCSTCTSAQSWSGMFCSQLSLHCWGTSKGFCVQIPVGEAGSKNLGHQICT